MLQIGKIQTLKVVNPSKFGVYLSDSLIPGADRVLLPKGETTEDMVVGASVEVFVYRDSEDRIIATTSFPCFELGQTAVLKVREVTDIGAFLEWGLSKDLFLPFKEQTRKVQAGQQVLVGLYLDKSRRLCATMNVYEYLSSQSPYKRDDKVSGVVYQIIESFGAYVAVDNKYSALIPAKELHTTLNVGDFVKARVTKVKEDGRLDLSLNEKAAIQMDTDALMIYRELLKCGGSLSLSDKSSPEEIKALFPLSKNAFKRAIGHLYKEKKIIIEPTGIKLVK